MDFATTKRVEKLKRQRADLTQRIREARRLVEQHRGHRSLRREFRAAEQKMYALLREARGTDQELQEIDRAEQEQLAREAIAGYRTTVTRDRNHDGVPDPARESWQLHPITHTPEWWARWFNWLVRPTNIPVVADEEPSEIAGLELGPAFKRIPQMPTTADHWTKEASARSVECELVSGRLRWAARPTPTDACFFERAADGGCTGQCLSLELEPRAIDLACTVYAPLFEASLDNVSDGTYWTAHAAGGEK